jgi:Ca2+:H+ antiporter
MAGATISKLPWWAWVAPALGLALALSKLSPLSPLGVLMAVLLGASVFASVLHAEVVAARVGEPYGTLVLAVAITVIETGLILSLMISSEQPALLRDAVFATLMIALNGVMGMALILGGARHFEQGFAARGASAFLTVVITIATMALVLPNTTTSAPGPVFAPGQMLFVVVSSLVLYGIFLFVMTVRHRNDFLHGHGIEPTGTPPNNRVTLRALLLLCLSLLAVVLLAKAMAPALEAGVARMGAPVTVVGVVIAALVLMPEGVTALRAARRNQLQMALNLTLGSVLACIGLTIPVVGIWSLMAGKPLLLGLDPTGVVLLALTFLVSALTLATGRTTVLQGAVHLVIFATFLLLSFQP